MHARILAVLTATLIPVAFVSADEGWKPLVQADSLAGWIGKDGKPAQPGGWTISKGELSLEKPGAGDLVSAEEFGDCEIEFEWKISEGGNGGFKYRVRKSGNSWIGCEYQILDDKKHPNGKVPKTTAASLYDVLAPEAGKEVKAVGEWNTSRIVSKGKHLEHWLNGKRVLNVEVDSPAFTTAVAASKFNKTAGFAQPGPGRLLIQDHGDKVSLRNLRIKPLKAE